MTFQNIMSVDVPKYEFRTSSQDPGEIYPMALPRPAAELDDAVDSYVTGVPGYAEAGGDRKTSQLLAEEIEKTADGSTPWSM